MGGLSSADWDVVFLAAEEYVRLELRLNSSFKLGLCNLRAREAAWKALQVFHQPKVISNGHECDVVALTDLSEGTASLVCVFTVIRFEK